MRPHLNTCHPNRDVAPVAWWSRAARLALKLPLALLAFSCSDQDRGPEMPSLVRLCDPSCVEWEELLDAPQTLLKEYTLDQKTWEASGPAMWRYPLPPGLLMAKPTIGEVSLSVGDKQAEYMPVASDIGALRGESDKYKFVVQKDSLLLSTPGITERPPRGKLVHRACQESLKDGWPQVTSGTTTGLGIRVTNAGSRPGLATAHITGELHAFAALVNDAARSGTITLTVNDTHYTSAPPRKLTKQGAWIPFGYVSIQPGDPITFRTIETDLDIALWSPIVTNSADELSRDVDLVVVDTMRADLLLGDADAMPRLSALTQKGHIFSGAVSPASWTLPAHVSMFSALAANQHGVVRPTQKVPNDIKMLAEHIRDKGGVSVAVTDSYFVSRRFGLDKGFDIFIEYAEWNLPKTLKTLEQVHAISDHVGLFAFTQTYRLHTPYREGPEEDSSHYENTVGALAGSVAELGGDGSLTREKAYEELRELYKAGANAADTLLADAFATGPLAKTLERGGGVILTSDHAELFGEQARIGHGHVHFPDMLRVPLVVWSDMIAPGVTPSIISLEVIPQLVLELSGRELRMLRMTEYSQGAPGVTSGVVGDTITGSISTAKEWKVIEATSAEASVVAEFSSRDGLEWDRKYPTAPGVTLPRDLGHEENALWTQATTLSHSPADQELSEEVEQMLEAIGYKVR